MAENKDLQDFFADLQSDDPERRYAAIQSAGQLRARPLKRLASLATAAEMEVSRAANRAMWRIVRTVGAPEAQGQRMTAARLSELVASDDLSDQTRREILCMLSEIGGGPEVVKAIAPLLNNPALREDARLALERIPGGPSLAALKAGFQNAPEDFKYNLAQSLRKRGVEVEGYPCQKMVPKRATTVKPMSA